MRSPLAHRLALACVLLALVAPARVARAGGVGVSDPPDSVVAGGTPQTSSSSINEWAFNHYKVPVARGARANRDFEFLWSDTYRARFHMPLDSLSGPQQINDMDRLGQAVSELWQNPFALPMTDIEIAYNMLAMRDTLLDAQGQPFERDAAYNPFVQSGVGFRVAQKNYPDAERAHVDAYLYAPSYDFAQYQQQWGTYHGDGSAPGTLRKNYGLFPSSFASSAEDSLTGNAGNPQVLNAVMIPGPVPWQVAATHDYRWTRPQGSGNANLVHESLHALNADGVGGAFLHLFASAAEVVTGVSTDRPYNDFDYTYSLTPDGSNAGNAYPHWQAFTAWLAFNWRGADTTAAGWSDDLLRRWATQLRAERTLGGLVRRLRDAECVECAQYPGFAGLDSLSRLQRLLHDWRVAMYVNSPSLGGGRYGYPPQFGFSPAAQLWAWRDANSYAPDDGHAIPPIVTIGAAQRNQELRYAQRPADRPSISARPLRLNMFGAEYFVFKADPSLSATQQSLTVRVHMPGLLKGRLTKYVNQACETIEYSGRLYASVVTYSQASDSLHLHPEWATGVTTKSAFLDRVNSDLVFQVPAFGATTRGVAVVVSLEDGPEGAHTNIKTRPQDTSTDTAVFNTYDFELAVVAGQSTLPVDPLPAAATALPESSPAWRATGDSLAYEAIDSTGHRGIFIAPALGAGPARPLRPGTLAQYGPAWSPRDHSVAYAQAGAHGRRDLWRITPEGVAQQLTNMPGAVHEPVFSPSGSRIAYLRYVRTNPPPEDTTIILPPGQQAWVSELRVRSLDSEADQLLATFAGDSTMSNLRWTPDGRYLLLYGTGEAVNEPWHFYQVDVANQRVYARDGLAPATVAFDPHPGAGALLVMKEGEITWTPAYENQVPSGCRTDSTTRRFHYQNLSRRDTLTGSLAPLSQVTGVLQRGARWSPDGTKVAYTTVDQGNPNVLVTAANLNRAPAFAASVQSSYTIPCTAPFELPLSASDPDGQPVTYEVFDLPAGAQLQSGHRIYWGAPAVGQHWLIARALDPEGAVATRLVRLDVYGVTHELCEYPEGEGGEVGEDPDPILPGGNSARQADANRLFGGGGGGAGPARAVNTFLDGAASGAWVAQTARLVAARSDSTGHVRTRLVAMRPGGLAVDRARLLVVDHAPGEVAVAAGGGIAVGAKRAPARLVVDGGEDLSRALSGTPEGARLFAAGTALTAEWAAGDSVAGLALDCARAGAAEAASEWGVRIEVPGDGGWVVAGRIHPRGGYDVLAAPLAPGAAVRLVFASDTYVRGVAGYALVPDQGEPAAVTVVELSGTDAESGVERLAAADSVAVALAQGQRVTLLFDGPAPVAGRARTLFLDLVAAATRQGGAAASGRQVLGALPERFALHANRPNPFGGGTSVRFDVPRAATVRIEVFDAQGRRVRTLAEGAFEPGTHAVAWDGIGAGGARARPGVYLVRMSAGEFRDQRRMVLLGR